MFIRKIARNEKAECKEISVEDFFDEYKLLEATGISSEDPIICVSPVDKEFILFSGLALGIPHDTIFWVLSDKATFYQAISVGDVEKIVQYSPKTGEYKLHDIISWAKIYLDDNSLERLESTTGMSTTKKECPKDCMAFSLFLVKTAFPFIELFSVDEAKLKKDASARRVDIKNNKNGGTTFTKVPNLDKVEKPFDKEMIVYFSKTTARQEMKLNIIDIMARTFGSVYLPDETPFLSSVPQIGTYIILGDK
jgi:hypothetical protein